MSRFLLVALLAIVPNCINPKPPEPPVVVIDAGTEIERDADVLDDAAPLCTRVCHRLHVMPCPEGLDESNCVNACYAANASGVSSFDGACVLRQVSAKGLSACGVRCVP